MDTGDFVDHFERRFPDIVGRSVLVALSGGRDSTALLHLLGNPTLRLQVEAIHVHHGLRGAEADADAAFCLDMCRALEIPCSIVHLVEDGELPTAGEAAWRRLRYRALLDHAASHGISATATAHHRDDVAEGVLVQLLRGAGPRAMAGIEERTGDGVIRPLLPWSRDDITGWLERHRVDWREDSSNLDTSRLRNLVRHELLPLLEGHAPRIKLHLAGLADAIAEAEAFMAAEVALRTAFADPWDPSGGVPLSMLQQLPRALRARWLHGQMGRLGIGRTTRRQLELFHLMLDDGAPRSVTMGGRWRLRSAGGQIWAEPPSAPAGLPSPVVLRDTVDLGVPGWSARLGTLAHPHPAAVWRWRPRALDTVITVCSAAGRGPLDVLSDRTKGVRRLVAESLPRHLRDAWPVFCEDDKIRWIPGVWQHQEAGDPSDRVVEVIRQ